MEELIENTTVVNSLPDSDPEPETNHTGNWNDKLELAAKDIGDKSKSYKIMHIEQAQKTSTTYNQLMILGITLGPLSGIISGIGTVIESDTGPILPIISMVIGFLSGIIVSIIKFGKYDEISNANKQAAARYTGIESNVRRQLSLYRKDRVDAIEYMKWLENKYEEIFLSAPLLPEDVYEKQVLMVKELGLEVPEKYGQTITINKEYETTKIKEVMNNQNIEIQVSEDEDKESVNNKDIHLSVTDEDNSDSNKVSTILRTSKMANFPELNECSDKALEYELKRFMGFKSS
jgi:F0F1-type ATP synthase assembly protein I